jgi:hypothetical protein
VIGVHTSDFLRPFAAEFFELFKTPWEFYSAGRRYEVLICCGTEPENYSARLLLIYSGTAMDENGEVFSGAATFLVYDEERIPIYTNQATPPRSVSLEIEESRPVAGGSAMSVVRLGYNLFLEVAFLLRVGQPVDHATTPALELHINLLRDLVIQHTEYLIEIPARPVGHTMIACLTHDVDHPSIRESHLWPTLVGFLYRATLGSIIDVLRGRKNFGQLVTNWQAALSFPLIYAGFGKDPWDTFRKYSEIEKTRASTYFFIPTKGYAGRDRNGIEHPKRAASYAAADLRSSISFLQNEGREVGLHGIDSWCDASKGAQERQAVSELTGEGEIGVRMHWLYYDRQTPSNLEQVGYVYDSSVGYNDTIGFRAGTTQVFRPPGVSSLLELPLHIMDTALFYSDYLDLKPGEATDMLCQMVSQTQRFGGVLTINWHDRSLAPERLWGEVYQNAIARLTDAGAWFATCREAVAWFRHRRSIVFENIRVETDSALCISIRSDKARRKIPAARLRIHLGKDTQTGNDTNARYLDLELRELSQDFRIPMRFSALNKACA